MLIYRLIDTLSFTSSMRTTTLILFVSIHTTNIIGPCVGLNVHLVNVFCITSYISSAH
jgi:hypothetical protein